MKKFFYESSFCVLFLLFASYLSASAQTRVAVLPFQNMDGDYQLNIYCYKLQDSVSKILVEMDPTHSNYVVVPSDSIEQLLAELNIDPMNPQYPSDMWKVVKALHVAKVISGTFNRQEDRLLINAYVYDVKTKMPNMDYQATNIFKKMGEVMEAPMMIIESLIPILKPN